MEVNLCRQSVFPFVGRSVCRSFQCSYRSTCLPMKLHPHSDWIESMSCWETLVLPSSSWLSSVRILSISSSSFSWPQLETSIRSGGYFCIKSFTSQWKMWLICHQTCSLYISKVIIFRIPKQIEPNIPFYKLLFRAFFSSSLVFCNSVLIIGCLSPRACFNIIKCFLPEIFFGRVCCQPQWRPYHVISSMQSWST